MRLQLATGLIFLAALASAGIAAAADDVVTFDRAEFVVSDSGEPPPDDAPWKPIMLPDNWHMSRPGFNGQIWYRIHFDWDSGTYNRGLYLPRNSAMELQFFVNGKQLSFNTPYGDPSLTALQRPLIYTVPRLLRHPVENTLHIRVSADAGHREGLSRVTIGRGRTVRQQYYAPRYDLQVTSIGMFGFALLTAGLLSLFVWRSERREPIFLWFGVASLAWAVSAFHMLWPPPIENANARQFLLFLMQHIYVTPLLVLCLRVGDARYPRLETALWIAFLASCVAALTLSFDTYPALCSAASVAYLGLTIGFSVWLIRILLRKRHRMYYALGLAMLMFIAFAGYDWARWAGLADFDNLLLAPWAVPFLVLALGVTVVQRHFEMGRSLIKTNAELEKRVSSKVREAERAYRIVQESLHEQAVLQERHRIMNDMHDGLGARLVGLLGFVKMTKPELTEIEHRLTDILTELRAIVDSLEPVEGDLSVVLGNVRYRMRTAIEESGATLLWQVEPLPTLDYLTPETILAVERIVLEAITNSLRHSAAQTLSVAATFSPPSDTIIIIVADNGTGFSSTTEAPRRGLRNMRNRAVRIGASIEINSTPGRGTTVRLALPVSIFRQQHYNPKTDGALKSETA